MQAAAGSLSLFSLAMFMKDKLHPESAWKKDLFANTTSLVIQELYSQTREGEILKSVKIFPACFHLVLSYISKIFWIYLLHSSWEEHRIFESWRICITDAKTLEAIGVSVKLIWR